MGRNYHLKLIGLIIVVVLIFGMAWNMWMAGAGWGIILNIVVGLVLIILIIVNRDNL